MKRIILSFAIIAMTFVSCETPREVYSHEFGHLYVIDESVSIIGSYTPNFALDGSDMIIQTQYFYRISVPHDDISLYSPWVAANKDLIDQMEQEWMASPYYTEECYALVQFTRTEDISIICNEEMWGRERGAELVDMFLFKPVGPFFSYPDGKLLPDDGLNEWMTIDQWLEKACVCMGLNLKFKELPTLEELFMLGIKYTARNSNNTSTFNQFSGSSFMRSDLSGTEEYSESFASYNIDKSQYVLELENENWTVVENKNYKE